MASGWRFDRRRARRQSLEPLLINPVPRDRILLGKLLATALFSLASLTLGLLAFLVVGHFMPTEELGMSLALGPRFFAVALPMLVPLVLLICIAQILIAAFARTVREAQTYLGLAQLVPLIPSIVLSVLPVKAQLWMYAVRCSASSWRSCGCCGPSRCPAWRWA